MLHLMESGQIKFTQVVYIQFIFLTNYLFEYMTI